MSLEAPPPPLFVLRTHTSPVVAVFCSRDNERIYSGDAKGLVDITSTRSLRPIARWPAHTDALLGIEELGDRVITQGRDNKLHVWARPRPEQEPQSIRVGGTATLQGLSTPALCYSLDINSLNFCRFSLLPTSNDGAQPENDKRGDDKVLIALPNLVESSLVDIWMLPLRQRVHAAIGAHSGIARQDGSRGPITGIVMSTHLFYTPIPLSAHGDLRMLCAYEDGGVMLYRRTVPPCTQTIQGQGWEMLWKCRVHAESVMAMAVSTDASFALTVSADHLIGKYNLNASVEPEEHSSASIGSAFRTKHPGNGAIAIRHDGRVCAVGGWDGKVALYSTKSFKPLGVLVHHKQGCQAVSFLSPVASGDGDVDEDNAMTEKELRERSRWLITAGKEGRVSIWALMNFEKNG